jgi:hypothetical protein
MRTTLDIDDDILALAKKLAASRRTTVGKVLSSLARQALATGGSGVRNGVPLLPPASADSPKPTLELVNRLRE